MAATAFRFRRCGPVGVEMVPPICVSSCATVAEERGKRTICASPEVAASTLPAQHIWIKVTEVCKKFVLRVSAIDRADFDIRKFRIKFFGQALFHML